MGASLEWGYIQTVPTDTATAAWTRDFWKALAVCTWSLQRVGDDAVLYGWNVSLAWEPAGDRGAITIVRPPARWRRPDVVDVLPVYANFDPAREAREIAAYVYSLDGQRSA